MVLDEECKGCLFNSQLKKVQRDSGGGEKFALFKEKVRLLCENPPKEYCSPLLMRDIDLCHRQIFGTGIDYSKEKSLFNGLLLKMEGELYAKISQNADPLTEALKFAMSANYIDFAKMPDLNEGAVDLVLSAAERAKPDTSSLKTALKNAKTLIYLLDNCGEIVLDKIAIRVIGRLYPQIKITAVVRGGEILNDVSLRDARQVGLFEVCNVLQSGAVVPGTYLKEISPQLKNLLETSDVIISKGLGNLETLYGEGFHIFYCFTCKCKHIAEKFHAELMSAVLTEEK